MSNKQNINYDVISIDSLMFELQESEWDFPEIKMKYKLTRTKKDEKFQKLRKTNNIIIFKTIRYKLSVLNKLIQSSIRSYRDLSAIGRMFTTT